MNWYSQLKLSQVKPYGAWITPTGKLIEVTNHTDAICEHYYNCDYDYWQENFSDGMTYLYSEPLYEGWIRVLADGKLEAHKKPNDAQMATLFRYFKDNNVDLSDIMVDTDFTAQNVRFNRIRDVFDNSYVTANFDDVIKEAYGRDPIEADPKEHGYLDEWGDHHGPVKYVPDTWNYGDRGYPHGTAPIPLPKKLYHVTPYPMQIMEEGFKSFRDPSKQTFGGHGRYVSFTNLKNAKVYQQALQLLWQIANTENVGDVDEDFAVSLAYDWGINEESAKRIYKLKKDEAELNGYSNRRFLLEFLNFLSFSSSSDRIEGKPGFPLFMGTMDNLMKRLKSIDYEDIAILEASVETPLEWHNGVNVWDDTDMSGKYTVNTNEEEWRIEKSEDIPKTSIKRIA